MSNNKDIIKAISDLPEDQLNIIYNKYVKPKQLTIKPKPKKTKTINKTSDKYKILLTLVNNILKNLNKVPITDLTEFKDINRLDIIKQENIDALNDLSKSLFVHFNKKNSGFYRKTKNIVINCLRNLCKETGLAFVNDAHDIHNDQGFRKTIITYSIKNI